MLIREMSVLIGRCPYWRRVRIRELFVLERCPYWRGVCIGEVSVLEMRVLEYWNIL
jgi:ABC-type enterochelin transport system ATPase subunit